MKIILLNKIIILIKETKTCPAIILIDKRKNRVKGRIKKLINSIKIIIGIRKIPVENGSKWTKKLFILIKFINKRGNHRKKIIKRLKLTWLVSPKLNIFKLKKFKRKIIKKIAFKKKLLEILKFKKNNIFFNKIENLLIFEKKEKKTKK